MAHTKEQPQKPAEILHDFYDTHGNPAGIAKEVDDILFDWIGSNDQDLQDWHKNKIYTLKCIRDLFTALNSTIDQD